MRDKRSLFHTLENICSSVVHWITYLLMYVINPGHSFSEIEKGKLEENHSGEEKKPDLTVNRQVSTDFLLQQSIEFRELEENRRGTIDDKNKVLLTICAILFAADAAILSNFVPKWPALIPLPSIAAAVYLVLVAFEVGEIPIVNHQGICFGKHPNTEAAKVCLINENYQCGHNLSLSNSYRVGVHCAAWRLLPLSILMILIVVICEVSSGGSGDNVMKTPKSNEKLRNDLGGPTGSQSPVCPLETTGPRRPMHYTGL